MEDEEIMQHLTEDQATEDQARKLVDDYMTVEGQSKSPTTQEIIDARIVPRLNDYVVRPGKVSDSIFGGRGHYKTSDGKVVEFENPPLNMQNGTPVRLMVRTNRISTHDIVRGEIPF